MNRNKKEYAFEKGDEVRVLVSRSLYGSPIDEEKKHVINCIGRHHSTNGKPYADLRTADDNQLSLHVELKYLRPWNEEHEKHEFIENEIVTYVGYEHSLMGSKMRVGGQYEFVQYISDKYFSGVGVETYAYIKDIGVDFSGYYVRLEDIIPEVIEQEDKNEEESKEILLPLIKDKVEYVLSVHDASSILLELARKEGSDFKYVVFNTTDYQFKFMKERR